MNASAIAVRESVADKLDRLLIDIRIGIPEDWPVDMSMAQLRLLFVLHANGPLRVTDLGFALGVGPPTVTALSSKLEQRGFVQRQRDPADKRVVVCGLTSEGLAALDSFWRFRRERMDEVTAGLSASDLSRVAGVLDLLLARMSELRDERGRLTASGMRHSAAAERATAW